jgi:hypothetical protein
MGRMRNEDIGGVVTGYYNTTVVVSLSSLASLHLQCAREK